MQEPDYGQTAEVGHFSDNLLGGWTGGRGTGIKGRGKRGRAGRGKRVRGKGRGTVEERAGII